MSTEQQEQNIPPAVRDVADQMLDGRRIGEIRPQTWRPDIRAAIAPALAELAEMRGSLGDSTDDDIGRVFFEAMNRHVGTLGVTPRSVPEFGAYLRTKAGMATGKPVPVLAYPENGSDIISGHEGHLTNLRAWADDTTDDVVDGVDDQARLLIVREPRSWPNDGCQTSARAKEFLGRVMDYKRFRLSPLVPEVGMRLRVDAEMNRGAYFVLGSVVQVLDVLGSSYSARGTTDYGDGEQHEGATQSLRGQHLRRYHQVPEGTEVGVPPSESEVGVAEVAEAVAVLVEEPVEATGAIVADLNARITELEADKARLTEQLGRARLNHEEDNERIGQFLIQKADDRGWCSEYDEGIDYLNPNLHISLPVRRRDVEVEVSGYVRVPYCVTVTVTVGGEADDSDVEQEAGELVENNYSARDLVSNYADLYSAEVDDDMQFEVGA